MDLMEYRARELFEQYGLPVLKGFVTDSAENLESKLRGFLFPLVVKAQVPVGGRGKAGGVRFAEDFSALATACKDILGMNIRGYAVKKLLVVEKAAEHSEYYLSISLDRKLKGPMILFSACGGMEIEAVARQHPEKIIRVPVDPLIGVTNYIARYITDKSGLDTSVAGPLYELLKKLYRMFCENDCLLAEINPLAVTKDGLVTLDAKVTVDDSSLYRHPDILAYRDSIEEDPLVKEARSVRFLYIPCEPGGNVAVMSNGSGMIMSCMDLISKRGMKVGAALDLGGGATADRIAQAVRILLSGSGIKALFISIFGGITRCDEVADGISAATQNLASGQIVVVRMEGTNRDKGLEILGQAGNHIIPAKSVAEGIEQLVSGGLCPQDA